MIYIFSLAKVNFDIINQGVILVNPFSTIYVGNINKLSIKQFKINRLGLFK